jgi:diaminohydroxyphosphoribosylaminopyrimidine deaminase/5-amino-6-(5-phosphoribosylamino)uracil reductase
MMNPISSTDRIHLQRALEIGRRGWGRVHPNPAVGCVMVKDGEVIGEGWHEEWGGHHAEINALREAGARAEGATGYVSLEPCNHFGRTLPCSQALVEAGISRLVYGAADPGEASSGGALTIRAHGIEVDGPVISREDARRENPAFFHNHEQESTYLALKLAQTLDGRIAGAPGQRTSITGPEARIETHRLRAGFSGIMVGSNTLLVDDPYLTVREDVPYRAQPTRIVLDTHGRTPLHANLFKDVEEAPVLIITGNHLPPEMGRRFRELGAAVHAVDQVEGGVSLDQALGVCWTLGIHSVFCEGGGQLASELLKARLAQRLFLFVAPFVLGSQGVPAFPGLTSRTDWEGWSPIEDGKRLGRDLMLTYDRMS